MIGRGPVDGLETFDNTKPLTNGPFWEMVINLIGVDPSPPGTKSTTVTGNETESENENDCSDCK
jgi:hypothetical protein